MKAGLVLIIGVCGLVWRGGVELGPSMVSFAVTLVTEREVEMGVKPYGVASHVNKYVRC